ncbi:FAD-dependent monooxygenase [Fulvimarina endophytica]|uniref:FAD-dependent monooxygenase n=1 Tax=Fulvimarina endophytica TaxID=2293836 RepID=UPI001313F99D|nr:FAD-dependent monooxygenase [Fulvimarina endophytica]
MAKGKPTGTRTGRIVILGAGLAGLTTALALARHAIPSTIVERAETLDEVGAGLQLSPNALRILDRLDCLEAVSERAVAASAVELRDGRTGRLLAAVPVGSGDDVAAYLSVHRADLQAVLADAVRREPLIELELGEACLGIDETADGVVLHSWSGREERVHACDLLIAADGVNSFVADHHDEKPARFADAVAWRGQVSGPLAREFSGRARGITAWLGPRRHAVAYPIRSGEVVNLVLAEKVRSPDDANRQRTLDAYRDWAPDLASLIANANDLTPWPLKVTPSERRWVLGDGRTLLIGDAAHALLPYAAQGAAMALEDGYVLAGIIASASDLLTVGPAFERARRGRIDRVRKRASFHRFVYHLPRPFSLARDAVMAATPKARLRDQLGWLYDWTPPGAA